jgi:hypothetical protein
MGRAVRLNTNDILHWDTLDVDMTSSRVVGMFNSILKRTGSYTKTKRILRHEYNIFIRIDTH